VAKTAAVTGAASGIGFAVADALLNAGCAVALGDRNEEGLRDAVARLEASVSGASVIGIPVDVSDEHQINEYMAGAAELGGSLDVLVTCAAIYEPCNFADMTGAIWDATADINLRGSVLCAAAAARRMRDGGGGSIVLMSSIDSLISEPATAAYSAAKSALNSVSRSMAVDLSQFNIAVNAVAPGWVRTPMTEKDLANMTETSFDNVNPMRRPAEPHEIARVIRFLALEAPPFLTGSTLFVDGGQSALAPMPA
jgi:NAD(P)-dependent dehydrogenase (short-subunit alcohol dehydrogenase family)